MKVILDANIIIAFLLTKGFIVSSIFDYWERNAYKLLVSNDILEEYSLILSRLVNKGIIKPYLSRILFNKIQKKAIIIKTHSKVSISPDKKDNRYLECSKDGKADYLITRDENHLYFLKRYQYTKILSAKEFLYILHSLDYSN